MPPSYKKHPPSHPYFSSKAEIAPIKIQNSAHKLCSTNTSPLHHEALHYPRRILRPRRLGVMLSIPPCSFLLSVVACCYFIRPKKKADQGFSPKVPPWDHKPRPPKLPSWIQKPRPVPPLSSALIASTSTRPRQYTRVLSLLHSNTAAPVARLQPPVAVSLAGVPYLYLLFSPSPFPSSPFDPVDYAPSLKAFWFFNSSSRALADLLFPRVLLQVRIIRTTITLPVTTSTTHLCSPTPTALLFESPHQTWWSLSSGVWCWIFPLLLSALVLRMHECYGWLCDFKLFWGQKWHSC